MWCDLRVKGQSTVTPLCRAISAPGCIFCVLTFSLLSHFTHTEFFSEFCLLVHRIESTKVGVKHACMSSCNVSKPCYECSSTPTSLSQIHRVWRSSDTDEVPAEVGLQVQDTRMVLAAVLVQSKGKPHACWDLRSFGPCCVPGYILLPSACVVLCLDFKEKLHSLLARFTSSIPSLPFLLPTIVLSISFTAFLYHCWWPGLRN